MDIYHPMKGEVEEVLSDITQELGILRRQSALTISSTSHPYMRQRWFEHLTD